MSGVLSADQFMEYLPHRYPFLLVDRVLAFERHVSITGLKNVTSNEAFFQGHFPGRPVTPGVLILEAIAQVGGLLLLEEKPDGGPSPIVYMTGVDKARWRRPVVPGDQLVIRATLLRARKTLFRLGALAEVDGETVASAEISCHVVMESSST